jgi:hypothetical protein
VQGWLPNEATLEATINALRRVGYVRRADASLPEDQADPAPSEDASAPTPQDHQQMRTLTAGTLVLAIHTQNQAHADEVTRIMRENGATRTKR